MQSQEQLLWRYNTTCRLTQWKQLRQGNLFSEKTSAPRVSQSSVSHRLPWHSTSCHFTGNRKLIYMLGNFSKRDTVKFARWLSM